MQRRCAANTLWEIPLPIRFIWSWHNSRSECKWVFLRLSIKSEWLILLPLQLLVKTGPLFIKKSGVEVSNKSLHASEHFYFNPIWFLLISWSLKSLRILMIWCPGFERRIAERWRVRETWQSVRRKDYGYRNTII